MTRSLSPGLLANSMRRRSDPTPEMRLTTHEVQSVKRWASIVITTTSPVIREKIEQHTSARPPGKLRGSIKLTQIEE
jgi:hypothetical protein